MRTYSDEEFNRSFAFRLSWGSRHPAMARLHERRGNRGLVSFANRPQVLAHPLQLLPALPPERSDFMISQLLSFDARIDRFFQVAVQPFDFVPIRSSRSLNWRYADPRAGTFTIRLAHRDDQILGYAVLRVSRGKGYLADLLALPDRLDVIDALGLGPLACFRTQDVSRLECWLPAHHPYNHGLRRHGFRHKKHQRITCRALVASDEELAFLADREAAVHLTAGDSDLI